MPNRQARKTTRSAHHRANLASLGLLYAAEDFVALGYPKLRVHRAFKALGLNPTSAASTQQAARILTLLMSGQPLTRRKE